MKRAAELLILAALGMALSVLWLHYSAFNAPKAGITDVLAGTAERPFIFRQLAAWLVQLLMAVRGGSVLLASVELVLLSFVGWLWALRWLAQLVTPDSAMLATVLAVGPVGLLFVSGGYLYDPLTLALFTFALALLASRQWAAYAVLFPWLVICRETAIYLTLVYAVWAWPRVSHRRFALDLANQLIAFSVIKVWLAMAFAGNPGSTVEFHWAEHVAWLLAYPLPNVLALSVYGGGLAAALWRWNDQSAFLRAAAAILPAMFLAYWLVGFPGELRVFLEGYPVLFLLVWHTVWTRAALPTVATIARWSGAPWLRVPALE
jgi:hypothetical protein